MNNSLVPGAKTTRHSTFTKYWYILSSAICSFYFITILFFLAICYHIRHAFSENSVGNIPTDTANNECFPDVKNLKITTNLRYYALQLKLDLLEYKIQTDDGYVLILHRLIDPNHSEATRELMPPILLQHGLLSSSGCYLTSGLKSLAVYFLNQGYDVWLGNNRSGFNPLHGFFQGSLMRSEKYWDWDIKDLAYYDMPCIIDNVLAHKSLFKSLTLVGHLQGCTQSFLLLKNPILQSCHEKIETFIALAPAIYPGILFHKRKFLRFMSLKTPILFNVFFGIGCFLNNLTQARNHFYDFSLFGKLAIVMFNYLFEWNGRRWNTNPKVWHIHFIFSVSYVSSKLMTWWVCKWRPDSFRNQLVSRNTFKQNYNAQVVEDPKFNVNDDQTFFPFKESWFDNNTGGRIIPMVIFNGDVDNLVDGKRLNTHMVSFESNYKINENLFIYNIQNYSHLDVVWANEVNETIGQEAIKRINELKCSHTPGDEKNLNEK